MKKELRIIFIGTPDFAVESLDTIVKAGKNVVAVITAPDRKAGRGQKINESAVKKYAVTQEIPVLQPTNLKNKEFIAELKSYQADLQIVVAFRMLPEVVWNMPQYGTFNLHASLLPDYRGAAPINWAIINGEKETGVTTFFLKHKIDTGDLIFQEKESIAADETAGTLHDKLMQRGGKLVLKTVEAIAQNNVHPKEQVKIDSKEAPKIFKPDCEIDWNKSAENIDALVRGMSPYPTAWTSLQSKIDSKKLKVFFIKILDENNLESGHILINEKVVSIGTATNNIQLIDIQVEGKKRMPLQSLLNGFKFEEYIITK